MATCEVCRDPLAIEVDAEDSGDEGQTVPDDLELTCGCHFHWQCFLDQSPQVALSLKCPSCATYLPTNQPGPSTTNSLLPSTPGAAILTRYSNEGGTEENLDILPTVTEEAFLASNPEARPARALHLMAAEGDVSGIVDLLQDAERPAEEEEEGPRLNAKQLFLWKDPLNGGKSIIHVAIESQQEEVFWLALWLSSATPGQLFPAAVVQAAQAMGLNRLPVSSAAEDVRFVKDNSGLKAEDLCKRAGSGWADLVSQGLFVPQ